MKKKHFEAEDVLIITSPHELYAEHLGSGEILINSLLHVWPQNPAGMDHAATMQFMIDTTQAFIKYADHSDLRFLVHLLNNAHAEMLRQSNEERVKSGPESRISAGV